MGGFISSAICSLSSLLQCSWPRWGPRSGSLHSDRSSARPLFQAALTCCHLFLRQTEKVWEWVWVRGWPRCLLTVCLRRRLADCFHSDLMFSQSTCCPWWQHEGWVHVGQVFVCFSVCVSVSPRLTAGSTCQLHKPTTKILCCVLFLMFNIRNSFITVMSVRLVIDCLSGEKQHFRQECDITPGCVRTPLWVILYCV